MNVITPPDIFLPPASVFLAGSIENGKATRWQDEVIEHLNLRWKNNHITILNPRREDWDPTWVNTSGNLQMGQQVNWELDGLYHADVVAFYFDPTTTSPISLMELGLACVAFPGKVLVYCPKGYCKQGNVYFMCRRFNVEFTDSDNLEYLATDIRRKLVEASNKGS